MKRRLAGLPFALWLAASVALAGSSKTILMASYDRGTDTVTDNLGATYADVMDGAQPADPSAYKATPCAGVAAFWNGALASSGHARKEMLAVALQVFAEDKCHALVEVSGGKAKSFEPVGP